MKQILVDLCERGVVPDSVTRAGMRRLIGGRLNQESGQDAAARLEAFTKAIQEGPIAIATEDANNQHYMVPDRFFVEALGPRLKYSSCLYGPGVTDLAQAEEAMLAETVKRAEIADDMDILELGCGWGSLSLYMAEHFPNARIWAVSNSSSQREYIEGVAARKGFENLTVITADVAELSMDRQFDRVVSVEMFEHMRNYQALLSNISTWLRDDGKLFVHIFCHRAHGYTFEINEGTDWMAENFFTGGIMPSFDIFDRVESPMQLSQAWWINGQHYERTLNGWLEKLDERKPQVEKLFMDHYGESLGAARRRVQKWRMFFMASAELFGFDEGSEWGVGHYLLEKGQGQ